MARLPARVDWITHDRTGIKVALRLDKKTMTFQSEHGGQTYGSKDGAEVRAQVLDAIEKSHKLTFQPVIRVEVAQGSFGSMYLSRAEFVASIALAIARFYFSQEGGLRQISWDDYEAGSIVRLKAWSPSGFKGEAENFTLPFSRPNRLSYSGDRYYLPYSEEAWEGLQRIIALVEAAKDRLDTFLADPDMVAKLIAIGTGLSYPLFGDGDTDA